MSACAFPYIFSVRADVVCRLRVVCAFGQPFADGGAVGGRVVHLPAFKTAATTDEEEQEREQREFTHGFFLFLVNRFLTS